MTLFNKDFGFSKKSLAQKKLQLSKVEDSTNKEKKKKNQHYVVKELLKHFSTLKDINLQ